MSDAKYGFLPWVRQGIAKDISQVDILGNSSGIDNARKRSTYEVEAEIHAQSIAGGAMVKAHTVAKEVPLFGPGDIIGIDSRAIVRVEPLAGITDFEPNYLAFIEFYEEDFAWRYTPARPSGEKLRPWLTLMVLEDGEYERRNFPGAHLPVVYINKSAEIFPDPTQTWAWAHVHVNEALAKSGPVNGSQAAGLLFEEVKKNPNVACSRLVCPRKLKPNTRYTAFLLPAFEQGRLAALGADNDTILSVDVQQHAWAVFQDKNFVDFWPFFYEWQFHSGEPKDFEFLVRLLEPRKLDKSTGIGKRAMDIQEPGYDIHYRVGDGTLQLEGALRTADDFSDPAYVEFANSEPDKSQFMGRMVELLNLSNQLEEGAVAGNYYNPQDNRIFPEPVADLYDDPVITPPLYGQWHAQKNELSVAGAGDRKHWFNQLNADPRNRVPAGFGGNAVKKNQEELMDRAWEQVGDLFKVNEQLRKAQYSLEFSKKVYNKYFEKLAPADFTGLTSSFHNYVKIGAEEQQRPLTENIEASTLASQVFSKSFTKISRVNGPILKRFGAGFEKSVRSYVADSATEQQSVRVSQIENISFIVSELEVKFEPQLLEEVTPGTIVQTGSAFEGITVGLVEEGPLNKVSALVTRSADRDLFDSISSAFKKFTDYFNPTNWEGGFSFFTFNTLQIVQDIVNKVLPQTTVTHAALANIKTTTGSLAGLEPVMAYPKFPEPMYEELVKKSSELFLPNIEKIPDNTIGLLETNQAFIESYMVGLNHEMARELLWREYPTDRRGSYFRQFWDSLGDAEIDRDIKEIHTWGNTELGSHSPRNIGTGGTLVLVVRGELLKKFPNTLIYAQKGKYITQDGEKFRVLGNEIKKPIFEAKVFPDITFIGFELTDVEAKGDDTNPGWFFVIKERPGDPRFGMDIDSEEITDDFAAIEEWDDLSWNHTPLQDGQYLRVDSLPSKTLPISTLKYTVPGDNTSPVIDPGDPTPLTWGKNAAHIAGILLQLPFMIAVHAKEMLS